MKKLRTVLYCLITMLLVVWGLQRSVPHVSHNSTYVQQHAQAKNAHHLRSAIYRFSSNAVPSCAVYFQLTQGGMAVTELASGTTPHCMQSTIQFDGSAIEALPMLLV